MAKSSTSHLPIGGHIDKVGKHVKQHHKKYLWSAVGLFGLFKLFAFLAVGLSGYFLTHADWSLQTIITSPDAGSTQYPSSFNVTFDDGGAMRCHYTVRSNGVVTVNNVPRTCDTPIVITVGSAGNCRHNGTNTCRVEGIGEDELGNTSSNFNNRRSFSISLPTTDTTPPTGGSFSINDGATKTYSREVSLTTICAVEPGNGIVRIAYGDETNPTNRTPCNNGDIPYTLPPGDGTKNVFMRFRDGSNNATTTIRDDIILDTTEYEYDLGFGMHATTHTPNSGAWLDTGNVIFSWTVNAFPQLSGPYGHMFTLNGSNTYQLLSNGTYTETGTLADGLHTRKLTFDNGDDEGLLIETFYVDTLAPTGTILINGGAQNTSMPTTTLSLSASDANGISGMRFSCNNNDWTTVEPYATSKSFNITNQANAGCTNTQSAKTVYVQYLDKSGKRSSSTISDTIIYDSLAPGVPTITCSGFTNNVPSNYSGETICQIDVTYGPSRPTIEYFLPGGPWVYNNTNRYTPSFVPIEGTTNILFRVSDFGGGPTISNIFTIIKNTSTPTITINNPNTTPAQSKTITASASTGTLTMTTGSTSTICNATRTFIPYASATFSTEADNGKYVCYRAVDALGNTKYERSDIIAGIDRTAPPSPTCTPTQTFPSTILVECTTTPGTTKYTVNSSAPTCASPNRIGEGYVATTTLRVISCDTAGNASSVNTYVYTLDAGIAPTTPSMAPEPPYTMGTSNEVSILGGGFGDTQTEYQFCRNTLNTATAGCFSLGRGSSTTTFSSLTDGVRYYYFVKARNTSSLLESDWSTSTSSIQDATPPVTTIISPAAGSTQIGNFSVVFTDVDTLSLGLCAYSIQNNGTSTFSGIRACNTNVFINQATYCPDPGPNSCTIYGVARDEAGNTGNTVTRSFTIDVTPGDTTPPVLTQVTPVPSPTNDTTPSYTFHSTEAGAINYAGDCSPLVEINAITGNNTVTFAPLSEGLHNNCTIKVRDAAGNQSNLLNVNAFTVDTSKPYCTLSYAPPSGTPTNQNVVATCAANELVTFQSPAGNNTYTFTTNGSFVFNFMDTAGNTGTATATVNWIDKTAPVLAEITPVPSPTTDTTPNYTFSSTEAGSITYGGACSSATTTATLGNNTVTFNTLVNGAYTNCTIVVTDAAGNQSAPLMLTPFTVNTSIPDIIKPTCSISYAPPSGTPTNQNVVATCLPSEAVTFQSPAGTGIYTFTTNGSFVFNFMDTAGNTGTTTATVSWIDKTAPVLAEITPVPSPTTDTTPNYTFSSTEAGSITYGGACSSATTTATLGNNTVTFNTLVNGAYTNCTIVVTDAAGNQSAPLMLTPFTVNTSIPDIIKPTCSISYAPPSGTPTNQNVVATCLPSEAVTFQSPAGTGIYTFTTNGSFVFNFMDTAGNTGTATATVSWIDKIAPVLAEITPVPSPTTDTTPNYTFSSTEAGSITYGGACSSATTTATLGNNTVTFNTLVNGAYTNCTIVVTDAAGNQSAPLMVTPFTVNTSIPDIIKPTCSISYAPPSGTPTNQNVVATCLPSEAVTFQSPAGTGIYTFIYNGSYVFNFTDLAGNTGSTIATVSWIDRIAPVLTQITPVPSLTNDTTPEYTFSSTKAGTISYGGSCTSSTTTAIIGNNPITFTTLSPGVYNDCTIRLTDSVGNVSNILTVNNFTVDTTVPTSPTLLSLSGSNICPSLPFVLRRSGSTNLSPIVGGSQLSGYRYEVYSNSGMVTGMVLSGTTQTTGASLTVSSLSLGTYYMRIRAINTFGSMTASNNISFTLATQYCTNTRGTGVVIATPVIRLRNANLDSVYRSDPIVIFGLSGATPVSISRGTLFINNNTGAGGTTGMVTSNDTLYIEMISSASYDTTVSSYLNVLGLTGTFSITTKKSNCVLSAAEKLTIQNVYIKLKEQYNNDLSKFADFLTIFQSMVKDEATLGNSCNLEYLLGLIEEDLGFEGGIDTRDHITPNCKKYTIGYDTVQKAYYAPEMLNRYYFINRESIIRHLDYYNPGDCHVNTYGNNFRTPNSSDPMRHIAPNGKIYNIVGQYGGFSSREFVQSKHFDSLDSIVRYIDVRNPAKSIWNHKVDPSFTPTLFVAPNAKTYKIYKTDRGYMSYKLMSVRYYTTLAQLQSYITTNNPNK